MGRFSGGFEGVGERMKAGPEGALRGVTPDSLPALEIDHVADTNIQDKVVGIVAERLGVDKGGIKPETSFINDLGADSLDIVELVMEFEEEFGMSIPDDQAENIKTVGEATKYIEENKGEEG